MRRPWSASAVAATVAALGLVSGCSLSAQNSPLPGTGVEGDTYRLQAAFTDALSLTEGAPVRLDGATVGLVRSVTVEDFTAKVDMDVQSVARLHAGASARLRGTTPLGELYIDLDDGESPALLPAGTTLRETTVAPTIEDTMATTSVFLNGGGITELSTIVRESNRALSGREDSARSVLQRLERTTKELEASTDDIDAMVKSLAGLSTSLYEQRSSIRAALKEVGPTARSLEDQVEDLSRLLRHVEQFGSITSSVIDEVQVDLVRSLSQMAPILNEMNALEGDLTPTIRDLVRFAKLLDKAVPTKYLNVDLRLHLDQTPALPLAAAGPAVTTPRASTGKPTPPGVGGLPPIAVPAIPKVEEIVDPKPLIDTLNGILRNLQPQKAQR